MICPECGEENQDSAKFCKKCGTSLNPVSTIKNDFNSNNSQSSVGSSTSGGDNKNLIIICLTIIICAVLIAGGFMFLSNSGSNDGASDSVNLADDSVNQDEDLNTSETEPETVAKSSTADMQILSGTFSTGSSASDKTYCSVYVGQQYSGEKVKISVLYSFGGSNLNQGNIVPKTVSSDGYISVPTANALDYYPDHAHITIYDNNGNVLDTQDVTMIDEPGSQTF